MEKEKFEEIVSKLNYEREKWLMLHEIDSIILSSGRGLYPSWKNTRYLITKDNKILVKHGKVEPYGARMSGLIFMSGDFMSMTFNLSSQGILIESSSFYNGSFRQPKMGDVVRASENLITVYGQSHIKAVRYTLNSVVIDLWEPLNVPKSGKLSFYDPTVYSSDVDNCIHATIYEGIYMHFISNESKKKSKYGLFHEEVKIKDIKEINLTVGKEFYNKTYKLQ
jgi:hypothetical protein